MTQRRLRFARYLRKDGKTQLVTTTKVHILMGFLIHTDKVGLRLIILWQITL